MLGKFGRVDMLELSRRCRENDLEEGFRPVDFVYRCEFETTENIELNKQKQQRLCFFTDNK